MKSVVVCLLLTLTFLVIPALGQTFQQCADVTMDNQLDISDMAYMIYTFMGGPGLPAGRGDFDFRQNYNLGDLVYFEGYIFDGFPEGGCPPFPSYTLINAPDTLFLPQATVPAGSGSMVLPIIISNKEPIASLLLTARLTATNGTATISSVTYTNWSPQVKNEQIMDDELTIIWSAFDQGGGLLAGVHAIAAVTISFNSPSGGTISLDAASFGPYRFTHQVFGDVDFGSYNDMKIGVPHVVTGPVAALPAMSVSPDSLFFGILAGSGDPAAQTFVVASDGAPFNWSASAPAWVGLTPSSGAAGATVTVQPHTAGLSAGVHTGSIVVSSGMVYNSPRYVKVVLKIQAQYPAFDANCDGIFNISDIIVLILYIFGGPPPCDPCSGGTQP